MIVKKILFIYIRQEFTKFLKILKITLAFKFMKKRRGWGWLNVFKYTLFLQKHDFNV